MDKTYISDLIKEIFRKYLKLDSNYFSQYSDNGDNLFIMKDLGCDLLSRYEILNDVEKKCGVLFSDDIIIWQDDLTLYQYIDAVYTNIKKEKHLI